MSPTCGLSQIPKLRVFFCFFSGFGPIFLLLCFVLFFGVLSVNVNYGTEKNLSNSIPFAKCHWFCLLFNQFKVFIISQLFCVVLLVYVFHIFLGRDGDLKFQGFEFSCRSCFFQQKLFSQTHVEANVFFLRRQTS